MNNHLLKVRELLSTEPTDALVYLHEQDKWQSPEECQNVKNYIIDHLNMNHLDDKNLQERIKLAKIYKDGRDQLRSRFSIMLELPEDILLLSNTMVCLHVFKYVEDKLKIQMPKEAYQLIHATGQFLKNKISRKELHEKLLEYSNRKQRLFTTDTPKEHIRIYNDALRIIPYYNPRPTENIDSYTTSFAYSVSVSFNYATGALCYEQPNNVKEQKRKELAKQFIYPLIKEWCLKGSRFPPPIHNYNAIQLEDLIENLQK